MSKIVKAMKCATYHAVETELISILTPLVIICRLFTDGRFVLSHALLFVLMFLQS